MRTQKLVRYGLAALAILMPLSASAKLNMERVDALLFAACEDAIETAHAPDREDRLQSLEDARSGRQGVDEVIALFVARAARKYAENGAPLSPESIARCVREHPEARINILMVDDPAYHRGSARPNG